MNPNTADPVLVSIVILGFTGLIAAIVYVTPLAFPLGLRPRKCEKHGVRLIENFNAGAFDGCWERYCPSCEEEEKASS